jgi:uncharacterized membrane protein YdjX (TVP38/TMEM64 family)
LKKKQILRAFLESIPGILLLGILFLYCGRNPSALLQRLPAPPLLAGLFLLGLFALKGLTVFFPLSVLEIACGLLFPLPAALAVNFLGVAAAMTAPYFAGRRKRENLYALLKRWPKLLRLWELKSGEGNFLFVFLLRLAGGLPFDAVSFCLGAGEIPWQTFYGAGLLGVSPHLVAVTILGSALNDPTSPEFYRSLALNAAVSLLALALFRIRMQVRKSA